MCGFSLRVLTGANVVHFVLDVVVEVQALQIVFSAAAIDALLLSSWLSWLLEVGFGTSGDIVIE